MSKKQYTPSALRRRSEAASKRIARKNADESAVKAAECLRVRNQFFAEHRDDWIATVEALMESAVQAGKTSCIKSWTVNCDSWSRVEHTHTPSLVWDLAAEFNKRGFHTWVDHSHWTETGMDQAGYPDTDTWTLTISWDNRDNR